MNQTECFLDAQILLESVQRRTAIFETVIIQVPLENGGPERCPWTGAIIEGILLFAKAIYSNVFMCLKH